MLDSPIFMQRICKIHKAPGDDPKDLTIDFYLPESDGEGAFEARARIYCEYFDQKYRLVGEDTIQAVTCAMEIVLLMLKHHCKEYGYDIYWARSGDLFMTDFWTYER